MSAQSVVSPGDMEAFCKDPCEMANLSIEQMYSIDQAELDGIQLAGLRKRFAELSPKLPPLKKLTEENHIAAFNSINDIVPLLFPHTVYKSYPLSLIDNGHFEQLNNWLNDLTTYDLSGLDVSACQSLDDWLAVVESNTPVRVLTSSGTSGKISLVPRSTLEDGYVKNSCRSLFARYGKEAGLSEAFGPDVYYVYPFNRYGRHSTALSIRILVDLGFNGDESHVLTLGGKMSTDVLWMTGRLKKAQADGKVEQLKKTRAWQRLSDKLAMLEAGKKAGTDDGYYKDVLTRLKDKNVVLMFGLTYYLAMVECAEKYGLEIRFSPNSYLNVAGGMKWAASVTEAQKEKIRKAIPHHLNEIYGCSEMLSGSARKCPEGHYHAPPWQVNFVLDPDTGVPYPRKGTQTGRYAGFDLWAMTYWGGFITGDEVTINWDGGCACGRKGAYLDERIVRYTDKRGGDDKITCQRTSAAVEEMMEHFSGK